MKEKPAVKVIDMFMFGGVIHRVIEVPVNQPIEQVNKYIDIKTGKLVSIDENQISMRMVFCEFTPTINMHPDAKKLVVQYFS